MAGTDPEDFDDQTNHERLIRLLENAGNRISEEVFEFWTQNTDLSVKLDVKPPEKGASGPLSAGTNLQVRVYNEKHGASVPFDQRSRGFVWFFSFLAYFTELEAAGDTDLILLDGTWQVLSREPMLRSRIYRRVQFRPLTNGQVTTLIPAFHPVYAGVDGELLLFVDDNFACPGG